MLEYWKTIIEGTPTESRIMVAFTALYEIGRALNRAPVADDVEGLGLTPDEIATLLPAAARRIDAEQNADSGQ